MNGFMKQGKGISLYAFYRCVILSSIVVIFSDHAYARSVILPDGQSSVGTNETKLTSVRSVPEQPKVGERISLFFTMETSFTRQLASLSATLGGTPLKLEQVGEKLWSVSLNPYMEIGSHDGMISLYVREEKEATRIQDAIKALKKDIRALEKAIDQESDPVKKAALEKERTAKEAFRSKLELDLEALNVFFASEPFSLSIAANPADQSFPHLLSVAPNAAPMNKRIPIMLTGENFPADPRVKFGDQNATVLSATSTAIEVLAPNFSEPGPRVIEVFFPNEARKNTFLTNSFFVSDRTVLQNLRPIAVTTGYVKVHLPEVAQLTASNSYDLNSDALRYEWEMLAVPAGSSLTTGTFLADSPTPSFTPDVLGIYRVRLRLYETETEEAYSSYPSIVTIEVK